MAFDEPGLNRAREEREAKSQSADYHWHLEENKPGGEECVAAKA
jgi:hypothetical protein